MSFVLFDTEYIADKGFLEDGFDGWKNREVIQIAALKIDEKLEVSETFNVYVKPLKHEHISPYFSDLTGITDKTTQQQGGDFPTAYKLFLQFVQNDVCYSHGWGADDDADGVVMRETLSYYDLKNVQQLKYKNIAPWFKKQYIKNNINITKQASGEIAHLLGKEDVLKKLNLQPHNALYDVYSLLVGIRYFNIYTEYFE